MVKKPGGAKCPLAVVTASHTHRENFIESGQFKPKSDCINHFRNDLEPNGRPFGSKSFEKW